jgi:hypothetical protein
MGAVETRETGAFNGFPLAGGRIGNGPGLPRAPAPAASQRFASKSFTFRDVGCMGSREPEARKTGPAQSRKGLMLGGERTIPGFAIGCQTHHFPREGYTRERWKVLAPRYKPRATGGPARAKAEGGNGVAHQNGILSQLFDKLEAFFIDSNMLSNMDSIQKDLLGTGRYCVDIFRVIVRLGTLSPLIISFSISNSKREVKVIVYKEPAL